MPTLNSEEELSKRAANARPLVMEPTLEKWLRPGLRLTELPYPKWWGFWLRFFKTFEVLLFKLLQILDLYRAQKSIVGIPSLATRHFTSLQAVVYNGTQDEVIGFRPKRILHKVLKGLPDLEAFERIRFQVALSDRAVRSIEASTETRGFIHLQLPWQLPWVCPRQAWLRMVPSGVETLLGRVKLGNYEVLSAPVFFLTNEVKFVVISDIDDTIKDSHVRETTTLKKILSGIFKGHYYTYDAIDGMAELYQEVVKRGGLVIYLTSTPYQLAPFLLKFLRERGFPEGPVFPRWLGYGRFGHKWRVLHRIYSNLEGQRCFLIGDSGEQDLQVYRRVCYTGSFGEKTEKVLIRHVPGTPRQKTVHDRETYYGSVAELRQHLSAVLNPPSPEPVSGP